MPYPHTLRRCKNIIESWRHSRFSVVAIGAVALREKSPGVTELFHSKGIAGVRFQIRERVLGQIPNVAWETSSAQSLDFDAEKLEVFGYLLISIETRALTVVRKNRIQQKGFERTSNCTAGV